MPSRPRASYRVTFAVLAVSVGSFALMQSLTVPVISEIEHHFDTSRTAANWVLTAYLLSASVATPIIGRLGDAWGKNRMLVFSLSMLAIGSVVAATAPTIGVMILARVIQGFGGGVFPLAFGIVRDEFPEHKIGSGVAIVSSLSAVGFGVGLVAAGPIFDQFGFDWIFWLPAIVTALTAVVAALVVPASPVHAAGRVPISPAILLSSWLVCLLLAISQAPRWGWTAPVTLGLVAAAALLAAAWIALEHRVKVPLIDMQLMRQPAVWTTNLVALMIGAVMYATFGFTPQLIQAPESTGYGMGATITESGLIMLPIAVVSFISGLILTPIARRLSLKTVVVAAGGIAGIGCAWLAMWHDTVVQVMIGTAINAFGVNLIFASLAGLIVAAVPAEQTGVANGMNANIRTIGGAVGTAVMTSLVTASVLADGTPAESGFVTGFWMLAGISVATVVAALLIPTRTRTTPRVAELAEAEPVVIPA